MASRSIVNLEHTEEASKACSVARAVAIANRTLESVTLRVVGEVSQVSIKKGYKAAYFSVKDSDGAKAVLECMMWMNRYRASGVELNIGQLVEITGKFNIYAPKGRISFEVSSIQLAGEGNLRAQVAQIAKRLTAEGLTSENRKRLPLPYPERIGLVTSPRGAAVHDVLRTLRRCAPACEVYFAGVPVEGKTAPQQIIQGMREVYVNHPDVILIVRGGGSFEDLMPFNDENLARAIAACDIPVVTGIGHEPDTTIADLVADVRASTPTGAVEAILPKREDLEASLAMTGAALQKLLASKLELSHKQLHNLESRRVFSDPMVLLSSPIRSVDYLSEGLLRSLPSKINKLDSQLTAIESRPVFSQASALFAADSQAVVDLKRRLHRALPNMVSHDKQVISEHARFLQRAGKTMFDSSYTQLESYDLRLRRVLPNKIKTLNQQYAHVSSRLLRALSMGLQVPRADVSRMSDRLQATLKDAYVYDRTSFTAMQNSFVSASKSSLERYENQFESAAVRLNDLSPTNILIRGFSISYEQDSRRIIRSVNQVNPGSAIDVTVADGTINCEVRSTHRIDTSVQIRKEA